MDSISRCAGDRRRALYHIGVAHRPFIGLLRAHGAADNQDETLQAEPFRDKLMLRAHVITDAHMREIPHPSRRPRVVRRGGETAADLIDDDDEILGGIECTAVADVNLLNDLVGAGVPGGNEDGVIFGSVERAERSVGELAIADGGTFFQFEMADVIQLVGTMYVLRVVIVIDHCFLPLSVQIGRVKA